MPNWFPMDGHAMREIAYGNTGIYGELWTLATSAGCSYGASREKATPLGGPDLAGPAAL